VLRKGAVVGRIMKAAAAPVGTPWMWSLGYGHHGDFGNRGGRLGADLVGVDHRHPRHQDHHGLAVLALLGPGDEMCFLNGALQPITPTRT
jgi:hypothetical protein